MYLYQSEWSSALPPASQPVGPYLVASDTTSHRGFSCVLRPLGRRSLTLCKDYFWGSSPTYPAAIQPHFVLRRDEEQSADYSSVK